MRGEGFGFRSALAGGLVAAMVITAIPAVAAVGDAILAGMTTTAGQQTTLKGDVSTANLRVRNTNPDGSAASFVVEDGNTPFKVNSDKKVKRLNADKVDGKNASAFLDKNAYDNNRDGIVDSAEIAIRDTNQSFTVDMAFALDGQLRCATNRLTLDTQTAVVLDGGISMDPLGTSLSNVGGLLYYNKDFSANWQPLGIVMLSTPGDAGQVNPSAVPLGAVGTFSPGDYFFAIAPVGIDFQSGSDYSGTCFLSATAYTGAGLTDVVLTGN